MIKSRSYEYIFKHIKDILISKKQQKFEEKEIEDAINQIKRLIEVVSYEVFSQYRQLDYILEELSKKDWEKIKIDLEKHFDIKMDEAIFLNGLEQQNRDLTWWSQNKALSEDNFYWNRYKGYIEKSFAPDVVVTLDNVTDMIVDNIGDPNLQSFERFGLVIGSVQSGKTSNYSAVINKATDAGYKFIVVIAGTLDNLRNQTQKRLIETYVGINNQNQKEGVGYYSSAMSNSKPVVLTGPYEDFKKSYADKLFSYKDISQPILLVIKKNVSVLKTLNEWLNRWSNNELIRDRALLVIDDESDYASINTKEEEDPTSINKGIRQLLNKFKKFSYVAYTATPYANILINHESESDNNGKDLFPRDFICTLKEPSNYFGAEKIFVTEREKYVRSIDKNKLNQFLPVKHKNNFIIKEELPDDLKEAIICFYLNVAIRKLMNQENKHNTMLVHLTRFTNVHEEIFGKITLFKGVLASGIKTFILDDTCEVQSPLISKIKIIFQKEYLNCEFCWEEVKRALYEISNKIIVCGEYFGSNKRIEYSKTTSNNIIAVGGLSLSRGFTLEGLSVSYFSRSTIFYDTLMQMGRWFGYRDGYEELCKIYVPDEISEYFAHISECTTDLIERIKAMNYEKRTPEEFGLYIKKDPENILQVTAKNKQKHSAEFEFYIDYQGKLKETLFVSNEQDVTEKNLKLMNDFIINTLKLNNSEIRLWNDIDTKKVLEFIERFILPRIEIGSNSKIMRSITQFNKEILKKYLEDYTYIDVALYSGDGEYISKLNIRKQIRSIHEDIESKRYKIHDGGRVSSGDSELTVFDKETKKEINKLKIEKNIIKSEEIRKRMKNPLLMLHIIEEKDNKDNTIPAYGVSFPKRDGIEIKSYKVALNTVLIKQLLKEQAEEEAEADD